jgi:hypothetical protein
MRRQQFPLYLRELFAFHSQYPKYLGQQNALFYIKMENDEMVKVMFQQRSLFVVCNWGRVVDFQNVA